MYNRPLIPRILIQQQLAPAIDMSIEQTTPVYLIVGKQQVSPCDHETFSRFKLWLVQTLTDGKIDRYASDSVVIEHWDDATHTSFPNLLAPAEIGTYLPIDVDPCPMFSSTKGLISELESLQQLRDQMEPAFLSLIDSMLEMATSSLNSQQPMEIR